MSLCLHFAHSKIGFQLNQRLLTKVALWRAQYDESCKLCSSIGFRWFLTAMGSVWAIASISLLSIAMSISFDIFWQQITV